MKEILHYVRKYAPFLWDNHELGSKVRFTPPTEFNTIANLKHNVPMANFIADIAMRLKIARIASGYPTAKEFILKHSIPASTYSQHESGKRTLTLENIVNYAELLKINPSWLITGQGNPSLQGNSNLEEVILAEQERLIQTGEMIATPIPMISSENKYSWVNTEILRNIFLQLMPLISRVTEKNINDCIEFCFDLYNKIIATNTSEKERIEIIKICLDSFFKGLEIRNTDEIVKNIARIK